MPNEPNDHRTEILQLLNAAPKGLAALPGEVFSSGWSALRPGRLYVAGLNPGAGDMYPSLRDHVSNWTETNFSAYTDQCWNPVCWNLDCIGRQHGANCPHPRGTDRHQQAVARAIQRANLDPQDVFATNAVFAKSDSAATFLPETGMRLGDAFNACWPIHEYFLSIIQPEIILSLGYAKDSSAYSFFGRKSEQLEPERKHFTPTRRYASFKWTRRRFNLRNGSHSCLVIGLRHPSYVPDAGDCAEFEALVQ